MQIFLPYQSFIATAKCLDYRRLGKQRIECKDLVRIAYWLHKGIDLFDNNKQREYVVTRYSHHPCYLMWEHNIPLLIHYGLVICDEWIERGYRDNTRPFFASRVRYNNVEMPGWLYGDSNANPVCRSHRSNLLRKKPEHYSKYWPKLRSDLEYVWPVTIEEIRNGKAA